MGALEGFVKLETGAAHHNLVPELHEVGDELLEGEGAGTALYQGDVVDCEAGLEGGVLEEGVEDHVGVGAHLEGDLYADTLAVGELEQVCYALYFLVAYKLAYVGDHVALVYHIRNFRNHYGFTAVVCNFDFRACAHHYPAAAGVVCVYDALTAHYDATCGEIGTLYVVHKFLCGYVRIVDVGADGVTHLAEVVGCHIGGHTYGDTGGAVEKQQRQLGGKDGGLLEGVVEVEGHIHRVFVKVCQDVFCHLGELGLCVSHGGDGVSVHGSEVALTEYQGVTLVPGLGEARHCVVYA